MKKNFKLSGGVLLVLTASLICSCVSVEGVTLTNVPSDNTEQSIIRGKTFRHAEITENIDISAYAQPTYEGDEIQFTVGVSNNSESDFFLNDADFELYRGNHETGEWQSQGRWNATEYYQAKYRQMKTEETLAAITGALYVVNSALGSTSYSTVSTPSGTARVTTHTYSPAETALTAFASAAYLDNLTTSNRITSENLQATLLFPSNIPAKTSYGGNILLKADNRSPEYKITFNSEDGETVDFIFSRSDRDAVINPWKDQTRDRHSIVLSHAIPQDRWQLTYYWSVKDRVGMYTGLSFYDFLTQYDIGLGLPIGITYRVFPNSWLVAGLEPSFQDTFNLAPQIGFNFIFNWIDVSAILTYRYPLSFYFDVGLGIAF